jgi:hypothetical protein
MSNQKFIPRKLGESIIELPSKGLAKEDFIKN